MKAYSCCYCFPCVIFTDCAVLNPIISIYLESDEGEFKGVVW